LKPYYQEGGQTIYLGDCRDILPRLPKVDLVLTDPPYGIDGARGNGNRARGKAKYIKTGWEDTPEYIAEVCVPVIASLVASVGRVILTPGNRYLHLYPMPPADIGCFWTPAGTGYGPWGTILFHSILYYGRDPRAGTGALPTGRAMIDHLLSLQDSGHRLLIGKVGAELPRPGWVDSLDEAWRGLYERAQKDMQEDGWVKEVVGGGEEQPTASRDKGS